MNAETNCSSLLCLMSRNKFNMSHAHGFHIINDTKAFMP
jgi:hypothetical protein